LGFSEVVEKAYGWQEEDGLQNYEVILRENQSLLNSVQRA